MGQIKALLAQQVPQQPVIDLMHDVPAFKPRAAAYLLASLIEEFPATTVFLAVVDPGVGSRQRRPCVVSADGRWYVGPDNGLFNVIARQASEYMVWEITWRPEVLSDSFHGRDLFAPVAAQLASGKSPQMTITALADNPNDWSTELAEIIYVDHFGNAITGLHGDLVSKHTNLKIRDHFIPYARVFADAPPGEPFWYLNSNGMIEIAMNQASAAQVLELAVGTAVHIS